MAGRPVTAMPAGLDPPVPFDRCFDACYGLEITGADVAGEGRVESRVDVRDDLLDHRGAVPVGLFATIAEAIASRGTALAVMPGGRLAMGLSNDTTATAEVRSGAVVSEALVEARGEDAWVWSVRHRDVEGRVCAFSRVTVAVRRMTSA
jgi:1,4-dihydroxy-2-naphthoyl-CoA hydrolase